MALDANIVGGVSGRKSEVDVNNNALVNLPVVPTQAGFIQNTFVRDASTARNTKVTEEGEMYGAASRLLFYSDGNGGTLLNNQWNTTATTQTATLVNGFIRLNGGAVTTLNTGVAITTARAFTIEDGQVLRIKQKIRHAQGSIVNKQFEFGLGMYIVAANQAGANVEFAGFRWTLAGALLGVLEYTTGAAVTTQTVNINGGLPYADNVTRNYEVVITSNAVEFWVNGVYQASIVIQPDAPCILRGGAYPVINRLWFTTAPTLAPLFDIGECAVVKTGPEADTPVAYRQSMMGRHCAYPQTGLTNTNGNTAVAVANAAAVTATVGSNTAAASTGLGGYFACTATNMGVALNNTIMNAFQNPAYTVTQGGALHGRNLVITGIRISPLVVTTLVAGGGAIVNWFVAVGNTAVSLATTDAAGTTALGSKSPRIIPLGTIDNIAAAAAAGTVVPRTGDSYYALETPLVVHPGEFISVGTKTLFATAAITAGVVTGAVGFGGYWE
jgi:hypothetical protein